MYTELQKHTSDNIFKLLANASSAFGEKIFLRYEENHIMQERSYLRTYTDSLAIAGWISRHTPSGKRIHAAFLGRTGYEYLISMFGVLGGNGIAIPLDTQLSKENMITNLIKADTDILFYDWEFRSQATYIAENCPRIKNIICLQDVTPADSLSDILSNTADTPSLPVIAPDQCAFIIFTSGTTGNAKGVMLSHANEIDNTFAADEPDSEENGYNEVLLNVLPIHHIFCINSDILVSIRYGSTVCICPDPGKILDSIKLFNPTFIRMVPMMAKALINRFNMIRKQKPDLSESEAAEAVWGKALTRIGTGGGYLSPDLAQGFLDLGIKIAQGYGMSECSPKICAPDYSRPDKVASVGRPVRGCEIRIENGEVLAKSPSVMLGYYKDEELTAQTLTPDGWLRTGDLGRLDEDGFLYLTGRKKNLIILENGENVSPESIENSFDHEPLISDILVFGKNNRITAEIYPNFEYASVHGISDIQAKVSEIVTQHNQTLPTYSQIYEVTVRKHPFEKTSSKKIIREKYFKDKADAQEKAKNAAKPETEMQKTIFSIVSQVIGTDEFGIDDDLRDHGLDSLGTVMLIEEFESKLGKIITLNDLSNNRSIKQLEAFFTNDAERHDIDYTPRDVYPLTGMQNYFGYIIRGNTTGNLPFTFELDNDIDLERLSTAITDVIDAHPILKGIIKPGDDKYLKLYRDDSRKIQIPIIKLTDEEWKNKINELLVPFRYDGDDDLFHISLYETESAKYMLFDVAHIIGDGMTMNILLEDVNKRYRGLPIEKERYTFYDQIIDYFDSSNQAVRKKDMQYYEDLLKGTSLSRSILNKKDKESLKNESNGVIRRNFDILNKKKVTYFCKKNGVSENVLFLTAFNYCTGLFSDLKHTFTCSIHSGRTDGRYRRTAGPFFLTYYCRYDVIAHETVSELLRRTGLQIMDTMKCSLSVPRQGEMFFQYQGDIINIDTIGGRPAKRLHLQLDSLPFHMQVMSSDDRYYTELRYWKNRFDADMLENFLICYEHIVKAMLDEKSARMLKHHIPDEMFPIHYSVTAGELNAEAGYDLLKNIPSDTRIKLYVLDERYNKKPTGAWGRLYIQDYEPDGAKGVINYPYQKGKILYDSGITARILPDGRIDFLENSGRTILTDGSKGRRYYDLGELERTLSGLDRVESCHAYMVYDKESGDMKLAMDIDTSKNSFINKIRSYAGENCGKQLIPAVVNITNQ